MSNNEFILKVVTPDGEVWRGQATSVVVPGLDGYFGIWANHMPLIAGMDVGVVMVKTPEEHVINLIAVAGGFVEVSRDEVLVLAESAELGEEIDVIRVDKALTRARERLSEHFANIDIPRAEVALRRAMNRKRIAERAKQKPTAMV